MRLGILSDSHGRAEITRLAVQALVEHGAELLIHLGDLGGNSGGEAVIDELVGRNAHIVLGNCDEPGQELIRYAGHVGVQVDHPRGLLTIDGKRIAFTHGHLTMWMNQSLAEGVDYLLHGHTHEQRDERIGATRVINPGALFRADRYTAAVLDPAGEAVEFLEIARRS